MNALPSTRVDVYRGVSTDAVGDETDEASTPTLTNVDIWITETESKELTYDSETPRVVRFFVGRVGYGTDIRKGDRLKDSVTDFWWIVDKAVQPTGIGSRPDRRLKLRALANNP